MALSDRVNEVKPVLSATPAGGTTGNHAAVHVFPTVHVGAVGESPESAYTVRLVAGATKPDEPNSVASERVVVGAVAGVDVGAEVASAAGAV